MPCILSPWKQFAWNAKTYFLAIIRKNIANSSSAELAQSLVKVNNILDFVAAGDMWYMYIAATSENVPLNMCVKRRFRFTRIRSNLSKCSLSAFCTYSQGRSFFMRSMLRHWSDCGDAQADSSFRWTHISENIGPEKRDYRENIFLFISLWKHMLLYTLEAPHRGASNEYYNLCFRGYIRKISTIFFVEKKNHLIWGC